MAARLQEFKEAYCALYQCAPEDFEHEIFWRCLYRRGLPLARFISLIYPRFFEAELELVRALGHTTDPKHLQQELLIARHERRVTGFFRGFLHLRLSGRRLLSLGHRTFARFAAAENGSSAS